MVANDWLMQFLADVCARPVVRPDYREMTAFGAAALAAMQLGWVDTEGWQAREVKGTQFEPQMDDEQRTTLLKGWSAALRRTLA